MCGVILLCMVFANSRYDLSTPVFDDWVERMMGTLVQFRREVHANPELSFREVATTERLMNRLRRHRLLRRYWKRPLRRGSARRY